MYYFVLLIATGAFWGASWSPLGPPGEPHAQEAPRRLPEALEGPQEASRKPQEAPETPEGIQEAPGGLREPHAQEAPRRPQEASRRPQQATRKPQDPWMHEKHVFYGVFCMSITKNHVKHKENTRKSISLLRAF